MIEPTQTDYWTRRRRTLLRRTGGTLSGAGLPRPVLAAAARRLGRDLALRADPDDEHGQVVFIGDWRGTLHDDCFVSLEADDPRLREALVAAALELHAFYLGAAPGPAALAAVLDRLADGAAVDIRSLPERRQLRVKHHPAAAGWWARLTAPMLRLDV